jgi:ubiquinone/menaquinone biosynthesis C-methylase UbiE
MPDRSQIACHWNDLAEGYDAAFCGDTTQRELHDVLVSNLPRDPDVIVELGCGTGLLSQRLRGEFPRARLILTDPAPAMLDEARKRLRDRAEYFRCGAECIDLGGSVADVIVSNFALHHLSNADKERCARECARILKPTGSVLIGDQFAPVDGDLHNPDRVRSTIDLLALKANYYFSNVSWERMMLQLSLIPRFVEQNGEIIVTPQFWVSAFENAGLSDIRILNVPPLELLHRVIVAQKQQPGSAT